MTLFQFQTSLATSLYHVLWVIAFQQRYFLLGRLYLGGKNHTNCNWEKLISCHFHELVNLLCSGPLTTLSSYSVTNIWFNTDIVTRKPVSLAWSHRTSVYYNYYVSVHWLVMPLTHDLHSYVQYFYNRYTHVQ